MRRSSVRRLPPKNADKPRDPEMHQTKKGNQWYFGMKAHFGVDSRTKLIHAAAATPANVADSTVLPALLHGKETRVWGNQAYRGQRVVIRQHAPKAQDFVNRRYRHPVSWIRSNGRKTASDPKCGRGSNMRSGSSRGIRLCQGALSRAQEEHASPARDLRAGQSVHGAPASIALPTGVMCPQPVGKPCRHPMRRQNGPNYPVPSPVRKSLRPLIHAPAPCSDVP